MTYAERLRAEGKAEGEAEGEAKGVAKGKAEAILLVLAARNLVVDEAVRTRVTTCHDVATLESWLQLAATVDQASSIFEG